jgi:hypothetical protein
MVAAELERKSPSVPLFFKGGIFSAGFSPLFGKEGKGRFLGGMEAGIIRQTSVTGY